MFFWNPQYLLCMAPAIIVMMIAQWYVKSAYSKWSRIPNSLRLTGAEVADRLRRISGLNIDIERVGGNLTDHYDSRNNVLRLSDEVARNASVAAAAIAAHELGHAMQDQHDYFPMRFRAALVPMVNIGSYLGWILLLIGFFLQNPDIAWFGVIAFAGGAFFALATLPVEFNASKRARQLLEEANIIVNEDERRGVNRVLNAAALTYVAALFTAVMQLLYYASIVLGMGRRRN